MSLTLTLPPVKIKRKRQIFDTKHLKNIRDFFTHKRLKYSYIARCGLAAWWALIYIYIPLFAIDRGVAHEHVAMLLSIMVIPLVLGEYMVGRMAKKHGVRPLINFGFSGLIVISVLLFFFDNIYLQASLIVIASVFVAFLEPTLEIAFFKQTRFNEEDRFYSLYRTAANVGSLITKLVVATILLKFDNNYAFIAVALLMTISLLSSLRIKK